MDLKELKMGRSSKDFNEVKKRINILFSKKRFKLKF